MKKKTQSLHGFPGDFYQIFIELTSSPSQTLQKFEEEEAFTRLSYKASISLIQESEKSTRIKRTKGAYNL